MRIAQDRTPIGCFWALPAGWTILNLVSRGFGVLDRVVITLMIAVAIYFTIERMRYAGSVMIIDALPVPGQTFEGTIETPLTSEFPPPVRIQMDLHQSAQRRNRRAFWESKAIASPTTNEHGAIVLPFRFDPPAELVNHVGSGCTWSVQVSVNVLPILYRATFNMRADS